MEFANQEELESFLVSQDIDLTAYGQNEAKTLEQLWIEIDRQECSLDHDNEGHLRRKVYGAQIVIRYRQADKTLRLIEDRQVFRDGRERRRTLSASIAEKMQGAEEPLRAAKRALSEELGIAEDIPLQEEPTEAKTVESLTYPGFISEFVIYTYSLWLPDHLYKPEGYIEVQTDKSNYWIWQEE